MQKSLVFRYVPFGFILLLGILLCNTSCHLNPNLQKPGESYLQGEWQQDSVIGQKALLSYSLYHLKFTCDSFYFDINSFSKVNNGPDTCMRSGHWIEHVKGTYVQQNDTLHLKGLYCNANGSVKVDKDCFNYGDYEELFKVVEKLDTKQIQLNNTTNVIPINARLIKKNTCNPKPI